MSVKCGHCKERHETVAEVRACSQAEAGAFRPSTAADRVDYVNRQNGHVPDHSYRSTSTAERTEETRQAAQVPTKTRATEGMYRKAGSIYKVQAAVHGSGKTYAKRLVETLVRDPKTGKNKWRFEYAPGFVMELRPEHRLTIEQAKEFGALYGTCCVCGRTLTDEKSIAAGIGPVCAGKVL